MSDTCNAKVVKPAKIIRIMIRIDIPENLVDPINSVCDPLFLHSRRELSSAPLRLLHCLFF